MQLLHKSLPAPCGPGRHPARSALQKLHHGLGLRVPTSILGDEGDEGDVRIAAALECRHNCKLAEDCEAGVRTSPGGDIGHKN